jgi:hypothetical protein
MHVSDTGREGCVEAERPDGGSEASPAAKIAPTRRAITEGTMLRSMKKDLRGFTVGATDGDIGKVEEFYFDDASFTVRHLVVDTGGWLGGRKVLISPMALRDIDWGGKRINAALTKAQVEKSPAIDTDKPVSRQHEIEYYGYYGYPYYWAGPYLWGGLSLSFSALGPRDEPRERAALGVGWGGWRSASQEFGRRDRLPHRGHRRRYRACRRLPR